MSRRRELLERLFVAVKARSDWFRAHGETATEEEVLDASLDFDIEFEEVLLELDNYPDVRNA